jgi:sugar phosphate isomerase/epimerase
MLPDGIDGFIDTFGLDRCREIRIADNNGNKEEHLQPGEGTIDFESFFERCEDAGYSGHYMLAFNDLEDMLSGRDQLVKAETGI